MGGFFFSGQYALHSRRQSGSGVQRVRVGNAVLVRQDRDGEEADEDYLVCLAGVV